MQKKVYRIHYVNKLRNRILEAWDEMDQHVIDKAVNQWRVRFRACVNANGGHFEHFL